MVAVRRVSFRPPAVRLSSSLRVVLGSLMLLIGLTEGALAQGGPPIATPSVWQSAAQIIIHPWATILLLVTGSLLLFHDLLTPFTWGVTGTLGILCLGLVFAAQLAIGAGGWIGVILLLLGLSLLLVETHLLPGQGVAAVFGLMLMFAGMFWALGGNKNAAFALAVSTVLTTVSLVAFFAYLPKSPVWKQIGLEMRQRESGYVTTDSQMYLLGRSGRSLTVLRPSGIAEIHGQRVDVVTEGEFMEADTPVVVTQGQGVRVVVDRVTAHLSDDRAAVS